MTTPSELLAIYSSQAQTGSFYTDKIGAVSAGDFDSIQAAIDYAVSTNSIRIIVPPGSYDISTPLKYYPDKITLEGYGDVIFNFTMTTGYGMLVRNYSTGSVFQDAARFKVSGIKFYTTENITIAHFEGLTDGSNRYYASHSTFENCTFQGGNKALNFYTDAWCNTFNGCKIVYNNYGAYMPSGGSNYGERISFNDCTFAGITIAAVTNINEAGDFRLNNCSLTYNVCHVDQQRGTVFISDSFVEGGNANDGDDYWFKCGQQRPLIIQNTEFTIQEAKTKEIFYFESIWNYPHVPNIYALGLQLTDVLFISSVYNLPYLVAGEGRVQYSGVKFYSTGAFLGVMVAKSQNLIPYGDCSKSVIVNFLDEISSYTKPTHDSASSSIKLQASAPGDELGFSILAPCKPTQDGVLHFDITTSIAANNKTLSIEREYLDKNKTSILPLIFPYDLYADFESDFDGFTSEIGKGSTITRSTDMAAKGDYALKAVVDHTAFTSRAQNLTLQSGHIYIAIARAKVTDYTIGKFGVSFSAVNATNLLIKQLTAVSTEWDYVYQVVSSNISGAVSFSVAACDVIDGAVNLTGYMDEVYVFDITDIAPSLYALSDYTRVANGILEILGNKTYISTDKTDEFTRFYSRRLFAPEGTEYIRYNFKMDNMDTTSEVYIKNFMLNVF